AGDETERGAPFRVVAPGVGTGGHRPSLRGYCRGRLGSPERSGEVSVRGRTMATGCGSNGPPIWRNCDFFPRGPPLPEGPCAASRLARPGGGVVEGRAYNRSSGGPARGARGGSQPLERTAPDIAMRRIGRRELLGWGAATGLAAPFILRTAAAG